MSTCNARVNTACAAFIACLFCTLAVYYLYTRIDTVCVQPGHLGALHSCLCCRTATTQCTTRGTLLVAIMLNTVSLLNCEVCELRSVLSVSVHTEHMQKLCKLSLCSCTSTASKSCAEPAEPAFSTAHL
jgi:hypothetical protein